MENNPCFAKIRGLPDQPWITEINARSGPGTTFDRPFKAQVGLANLVILDVQPDSEDKNLNGKIYQWFKLSFPDAQEAWIRDDLLSIQGDCATWGYDQQPSDTFVFALTRKEVQSGGVLSGNVVTQNAPIQLTVSPVSTDDSPAPISNLSVDRIRNAAFMITAAFEGEGYAAYNNYDAGIISYGVIQFTLASGSLLAVIEKYLNKSTTNTATSLRGYLDLIKARDESLRNDERLKNILKAAAQEQEMRDAQNTLMTMNYWDRIVNNYVATRQYQYALTHALLFDIGVNFGVGDGFVRMAEKEFGIPTGSNPANTGITEMQIITRVAELRKISHDKQAARDNLPGLRARGDFWVERTTKGDWNLKGDHEGKLTVNGHKVQVENPS